MVRALVMRPSGAGRNPSIRGPVRLTVSLPTVPPNSGGGNARPAGRGLCRRGTSSLSVREAPGRDADKSAAPPFRRLARVRPRADTSISTAQRGLSATASG